MPKFLRNIQLNFADGEKKLTVGNLSLKKNYIHISATDRFKKRGCLLTKEHSFLTTQFDFTGAEDSQLLCFDEDLKFTGIKYYRNHQDAPFSVSTDASFVFVIPDNYNLPVEIIISLSLLDYPPIPGSSHIFGSEAEKVDILAGNPYRFYLSEYGVWIMRGSERINILNEMLTKSEQNKNEVLFKRIEEVISELKELPEYQ